MEDQIFITSDAALEMLNSGSAYFVDSTLIRNEDSRPKHHQLRIKGAKYLCIVEIANTAAIGQTTPWPTLTQFRDGMIKMGLPNDGKNVIIYDQTGIGTAGRGWLMLKYYGYPHVYILDGGLPKWTAEGKPTDSEEYDEVCHDPADEDKYQLNEHREWRVFIDEMETYVSQRSIGDNSIAFWDPRPLEIFQLGAVPTAVNFAATVNLFNPDKTVKSKEEVKKLLDENGIRTEGAVVTTCLRGVYASLGLALQHYIGNHNVRIYTGSWEEWRLNRK
ncbi:unnamed protein product [Blepharisma stoltei]|uniref:Rhodanese domain-containing protein n=1 Tax=Blepharisma stoltei TaxID=1481888 RepID=A0AAU9JSF5_9CILI|nr:unnamed protein product [Blepharisma stoltei]